MFDLKQLQKMQHEIQERMSKMDEELEKKLSKRLPAEASSPSR